MAIVALVVSHDSGGSTDSIRSNSSSHSGDTRQWLENALQAVTVTAAPCRPHPTDPANSVNFMEI